MRNDPQLAERTVWIDVCKGICIILVVYGHVSGGLEAAGRLGHNSGWMVMRDWVYLFHMPAFFVLAGLWAFKSTGLPLGKFLVGKIKTILYPYAVWTAIILVSQMVMSRFVNNPPEPRRAMLFFIEPYGYGLWFLYALFITSTLFYLLVRLKIQPLVVTLCALLLSVLAYYNGFGFWPILNTAMCFFIYYAIAACWSGRILALSASVSRRSLLLAGGGLILLMTFLFMVHLTGGVFGGLLAALLGIAGVVCFSNALGQTCFTRLLAVFGFYSLEIYLGHPLWGTFARVALLKSGIENPVLLVSGSLLIGIAGSLAVGAVCRRGKFPYLFRWPGRLKVVR